MDLSTWSSISLMRLFYRYSKYPAVVWLLVHVSIMKYVVGMTPIEAYITLQAPNSTQVNSSEQLVYSINNIPNQSHFDTHPRNQS